jgi:hypothetical protein
MANCKSLLVGFDTVEAVFLSSFLDPQSLMDSSAPTN